MLSPSPIPRKPPILWKTPIRVWVKVNCDTAVDNPRRCFGLGMVVHYHKGRVKVAQRLSRKGMVVPTVTKALVSLHAVLIYKDLGYQNIWLEGDAKSMCDAINLRNSISSGFGLIIADIRVELLSVSHW